MTQEAKKLLMENILDNVDEDLDDQEIVRMLLEKKVSRKLDQRPDTVGQRAADALARFAGSWAFVLGFSGLLLCWIMLNLWWLTSPFDPYPFILLNLVLSCVAAIQAPLIMMSQNRQEEKDRRRAENDYLVNLKSEVMLEELHQKLMQIERQNEQLQQLLAAQQEASAKRKEDAAQPQ